MRWIWIDKFVEFERGRRAVAIKNVSMAEEHLHDHFPGYPMHPATLMIEGMAQTGGILAGEAMNYEKSVILAKITRATFHRHVHPGDQLRFEAEVLGEVRAEGASVSGRITRNGDRVAEIELLFAHLDPSRAPPEVGEENFVFTEDFVRLLRISALQKPGPGGGAATP
jgi:3-hydroxyacyl-[acyl-carrier-protein] dehydratase